MSNYAALLVVALLLACSTNADHVGIKEHCDLDVACVNLRSAVECNKADECIAKWNLSIRSQLQQQLASSRLLRSEGFDERVSDDDRMKCSLCVEMMPKYVKSAIGSEAHTNDMFSFCSVITKGQHSGDKEFESCRISMDNVWPLVEQLNSAGYTAAELCYLMSACSRSTLNFHFGPSQPTMLFQLTDKAVSPNAVDKNVCMERLDVQCLGWRAAVDCGAFQTCANKWKNPEDAIGGLLKKDKVSNTVCDVCTMALTEVKQLLTEKSTDDEIEAYLKKTCSVLGDESVVKECRALIDQDFPLIIQMVKDELDPTTLCAVMGFCASSRQLTASNRLHPSRLLATPTALAVEFSSTFRHNQQLVRLESRPDVSNGAMCTACELAITEAKMFLMRNHTTEEIEKYLEDKVCVIIPQADRQICNVIVEQYTPQLVHMILNLDPDQVCTELHLCSTSGIDTTDDHVLPTTGGIAEPVKMIRVPLSKLITPTERLAEAARRPSIRAPTEIDRTADVLAAVDRSTGMASDFTCALCEFLMKELMRYIDKHEDVVIDDLKKACDVMPTFGKECRRYVTMYGDAIIGAIEKGTPETVCPLLRLCGADTKQRTTAEMCYICRYFVNYAISALNEPALLKLLEQSIGKICDILPSAQAVACQQVVNNMTPDVMRELMMSLSTQKICERADVCTSSPTGDLFLPLMQQDKSLYQHQYKMVDDVFGAA